MPDQAEKGAESCSVPAVDEEKLQEAFVRAANRLITDRDTFVKRMMENIEKVFREQASKVDLTTIDSRVEELRAEMAALVKLNLTAGIDTEIYKEEYHRITGEIENLRTRRAGVSQAEVMRLDTLGRVQEITRVLREMDGVKELDEELFGMLVERIRVISLVEVEFVLQSGIGIVEIL
jgi:site-specific DNA recombinase